MENFISTVRYIQRTCVSPDYKADEQSRRAKLLLVYYYPEKVLKPAFFEKYNGIYLANTKFEAIFGIQQFSCWQTKVGTLHATSLEGLGYDDVVHQFENRYKKSQSTVMKKKQV